MPPTNPRIKKEVKECAIVQLSAGAMPSNVHKQIVNNAPLPLSSADVPSLSQIKNWKHALSIKDLPTGIAQFSFFIYYISPLFLILPLLSFLFVCTTHFFYSIGDAFQNIMIKHNGTFLQLCDIASTRIVLASGFGLDVLANSDYVIVDGTHGTCKQKMTLTTILGIKDEVALPCAYFLSKAKDTETYKCFYKVIFLLFAIYDMDTFFLLLGNVVNGMYSFFRQSKRKQK